MTDRYSPTAHDMHGKWDGKNEYEILSSSHNILVRLTTTVLLDSSLLSSKPTLM